MIEEGKTIDFNEIHPSKQENEMNLIVDGHSILDNEWQLLKQAASNFVR